MESLYIWCTNKEEEIMSRFWLELLCVFNALLPGKDGTNFFFLLHSPLRFKYLYNRPEGKKEKLLL
jgi:hypothetical protein